MKSRLHVNVVGFIDLRISISFFKLEKCLAPAPIASQTVRKSKPLQFEAHRKWVMQMLLQVVAMRSLIEQGAWLYYKEEQQ